MRMCISAFVHTNSFSHEATEFYASGAWFLIYLSLPQSLKSLQLQQVIRNRQSLFILVSSCWVSVVLPLSAIQCWKSNQWVAGFVFLSEKTFASFAERDSTMSDRGNMCKRRHSRHSETPKYAEDSDEDDDDSVTECEYPTSAVLKIYDM